MHKERKRGLRQSPIPTMLHLEISQRRRSQQGRLKKEDKEVEEKQADSNFYTPKGASI